MSKHLAIKRWTTSVMLFLISFGLCLAAQPSIAIYPAWVPESSLEETAQAVQAVSTSPSFMLGQTLTEQGQHLYESGQLSEAAQALEQAVEAAAQSGDIESQIIALRNLALVYQQLRQFHLATQSVDSALGLIDSAPETSQLPFRASLLDVQGGIYFSQGQTQAALMQWEQAVEIYDEFGDIDNALQNRINQAQALQKLGFYRQAIAQLDSITTQLRNQPASESQVVALRSLGDALRFVGNLELSQEVLNESLTSAQALQRNDLVDTATLSLANTLRAQGNDDDALVLYQDLAQTASSGEVRIQALSNHISVLVETENIGQAQVLWPEVQSQLYTLSPSQATVFARVNIAQSYIKSGVESNPSSRELADFLAITIQQSKELGDTRSEAYALGTLAILYEQSNRIEEARVLNENALVLAQTTNASDISYLLQWQLGRLYKAEGDRTGDKQNYQKAISAYSDSVDILQQLRTDLVAINSQVQVSFQASVEPIHRELVSLLLDEERTDPTQADIEKARKVIESLQLAELDNFFREACLDAQPVEIDQLDQNAAVIYPIMLSDRLETIISLPGKELRHYATSVPRPEIEALVGQLRQQLTLRVGNAFRQGMEDLYNWIIRPLATDLSSSQVNTLVFVLDGAIRNVPMAALYDGQNYLIEQYNIAITPGLQLVNPQPLQARDLSVLTGALSEPRQGFSALPNVVPEVEQIQATVPADVLLNEAFTKEAIQAALQANAEPIVHLATHGKFSSNQEGTFILTWDGQLNINALNNVLEVSELNQSGPIELLVLSACQTAAGDEEAALGLAGMAVRAGARSTIATLWQVNDEATATLMEKLYAELAEGQVSKAEALRKAQIEVLKQPQYRRHPYYWAPYILVGNWL